MELTKSQKRRLREIADECYCEALENALGNLYEDFQKWGGKQISAFELDERIHLYHQKTARELYKMYSGNDVFTKIAFALNTGVISIDAIDSDLLPLFERFGVVS